MTSTLTDNYGDHAVTTAHVNTYMNRYIAYTMLEYPCLSESYDAHEYVTHAESQVLVGSVSRQHPEAVVVVHPIRGRCSEGHR